jgi:hypothetical protein
MYCSYFVTYDIATHLMELLDVGDQASVVDELFLALRALDGLRVLSRPWLWRTNTYAISLVPKNAVLDPGPML